MRFCRVDTPPPVRHLQRLDPPGVQLRGDPTGDLVARLILEYPRSRLGVETHPDLTARPQGADPIGPLVERYPALRVDPPGHDVGLQQLPGPAHVPGRRLPLGGIGPARVPQAGEGLAAGPPAAHRVELAPPAVQLLQPRPQLGRRIAPPGLRPGLADPLIALD